MILLDSTVLVHAFRNDAPRHEPMQAWLNMRLRAEPVVGLAELALAGLVRIVTHPRVFAQPSSLEEVVQFTDFVRGRPNAVIVQPGRNHWGIFQRLCEQGNARGNLVTSAYLAALAIESGSEWMTTDPGFARFPGLQWRDPLKS